ncbi:MAG: sodium ion-translocating decarboxylase subunit beta, partial [Fuerstiella sp.]|nr:sodium ion-translocating decarboxylase subunit beta [Fuerstiella sp.]
MNYLYDFLGTTGFAALTLGNVIMILIGIVFIFLAIKKDYEPLLLVPIGMGAIVGNIPVGEGMSLSVYDEHQWHEVAVDSDTEETEIVYSPGSVLSY